MNRPVGIIDAHVHFWDQDLLRYPWLDDDRVLARRYGPDMWSVTIEPNGVAGVVVVQADCRPEDAAAEVEFIGRLAHSGVAVSGIVAYVPIENDSAAASIREVAAMPFVVGIRRNIQGKPIGYARTAAGGLHAVAEANLPFDLCVTADQLSDVVSVVAEVPNGRFVLDHLGKPAIGCGGFDRWAAEISELASLPNVWCKLSGLATQAPTNSPAALLRPYLDHAIDRFGSRRCIFGSDWPVASTATTYSSWLRVVAEAVDSSAHDAVFRDNAVAFYRLDAGTTRHLDARGM